jgi:hypothetical protein
MPHPSPLRPNSIPTPCSKIRLGTWVDHPFQKPTGKRKTRKRGTGLSRGLTSSWRLAALHQSCASHEEYAGTEGGGFEALCEEINRQCVEKLPPSVLASVNDGLNNLESEKLEDQAEFMFKLHQQMRPKSCCSCFRQSIKISHSSEIMPTISVLSCSVI